MRKILKNTIVLIFIITCFSCDDMRDLYPEYQGKETKYSTILDSVKSYPGVNRVKITGIIANPLNVKTIFIKWDNDTKMRKFEYKKIANTDSVFFYINDLPERSYFFNIYTTNNTTSTSIKVTTSAVSYGDIFQSGLKSRQLRSFIHKDNDVNIVFARSLYLGGNTKLSFVNLDGKTVNHIIDKDSTKLTLVRINLDREISLITNYKPTENCLDSLDSKQNLVPTDLYKILKSFTTKSIGGGTIISWENPKNLIFDIIAKINNNSATVNLSPKAGQLSDTIYNLEDKNITFTLKRVGFSFVKNMDVNFAAMYAKIDKINWKVTSSSSDNGWGNGINSVFDNDINTFWHSDPSGQEHDFVIEMETPAILKQLQFTNRQGYSSGSTKIELFVSADNITYDSVGQFDLSATVATGQLFKFENSLSGKYFKVKSITSPNDYFMCAEINCYKLSE